MSHPLSFKFKGLMFTFEHAKLYVEDRVISLHEFILFARGKIDLAPKPKPTIVDIVLNASGSEGLDDNGGDFDILREALTATDLVGTLADTSADFTVFAPTDAAFIELARSLGATVEDGDEAGALSAILSALEGLAGSPEGGLELLKQVLLYHVAPDGRSLEQLQADGTITTVQGGTIDVDGTTLIDAEPDIENPTIASADIEASNGTIQVLDRVLLPIDIPGNDLPNIVDIAVGNEDFQILVKALDAAGLVGTVQGLEDVTVFAPTDAAFGALAADLGFTGDTTDEDAVFGYLVGALTDLGGGDPIPLLTNILLYHVSAGAKSANQIDALEQVETLLDGATFGSEGTELVDNEPDVANPNIVIPDIAAENGTIQAIDRVLLPIDIPGNTVGQTIDGTKRGDHLQGGGGDDVINGFGGRDKLEGGNGNDILNGGRGRDHLDGGAGDDHLTGGWGKDYFDFRDVQGNDVVKDFGFFDRIVLSKDDVPNFHALQALTSTDGHDTLITIDDGSIRLAGVDEHHLNAHQFIFV